MTTSLLRVDIWVSSVRFEIVDVIAPVVFLSRRNEPEHRAAWRQIDRPETFGMAPINDLVDRRIPSERVDPFVLAVRRNGVRKVRRKRSDRTDENRRADIDIPPCRFAASFPPTNGFQPSLRTLRPTNLAPRDISFVPEKRKRALHRHKRLTNNNAVNQLEELKPGDSPKPFG